MMLTRLEERAAFMRVNDEIVQTVELGFPERRLVAEDPFTAVGRVYARFLGSGLALLASEGDSSVLVWQRDPSLSLSDCVADQFVLRGRRQV